jgi:myo-inositol 2-dehydrogenase/D-chiro-inositol 1-dehydrogenase
MEYKFHSEADSRFILALEIQMTVKFALLGAGRIGKVHAKAVTSNPDAQLVAVTDAMPAAAEALAQQYGARVSTMDDIAIASDVDAVIICTPTDTHADLIQKYSDAGKAIFCEKPIDLDVERVKACLQTVASNKTALMVGFNRRFDPSFAAVKAEIDAGTIGDVEQVVITSRDPGLPPYDYIPVSGGIFRDMTIHDFDMARFLLGEEVETVMATGSCLVDPKVQELGDFDTAAAILTTASGKQAIINNSRRATYGYDQRIEVHGSKGSVSAQNERPVNIEVATASGYTAPPLHDFFMTRYVAAYAAEIAEFVEVVKNGKAPSPSGTDGLAALAIAEAAETSVATGASVRPK